MKNHRNLLLLAGLLMTVVSAAQAGETLTGTKHSPKSQAARAVEDELHGQTGNTTDIPRLESPPFQESWKAHSEIPPYAPIESDRFAEQESSAGRMWRACKDFTSSVKNWLIDDGNGRWLLPVLVVGGWLFASRLRRKAV